MTSRSVRVLSGAALALGVAVVFAWTLRASDATVEPTEAGPDRIVGSFAVVQLVHAPMAPGPAGVGTSTSTRLRVTWLGAAGADAVATEAFGRIESIDEHWLVLADAEGGARVCIPRERVQVVEVVSEEEMKRRRMKP